MAEGSLRARLFWAFRRRRPLWKMAVCLQFYCLALWGPMDGCLIGCSLCFLLLLIWPRGATVATSPWTCVAFCTFATLIAVPGGDANDVIIALRLSVRLLLVLLTSAALGRIATPGDIVAAARQFRLPRQVQFAIGVLARFVPLAIQTMQSVALAQRSRGLYLGIRHLVRRDTYRALAVPYVVSVLRSAMQLWISVNLRPFGRSHLSSFTGRRGAVFECASLSAAMALWLLRVDAIIPALFFSW